MRLIDADKLSGDHDDIEIVAYLKDDVYEYISTKQIDSAPTIDLIKHGRWELHPIYPKEWDVCTSCGIGTKRREYGINPDGTEWRSEASYTYCPWCGAKMDEVK